MKDQTMSTTYTNRAHPDSGELTPDTAPTARYTSAADVVSAIRAAAADAPEWNHPDRWPLPLLIPGDAGPVELHGPRTNACRVTFAYAIDGARGSYSVEFHRGRLLALADKVHSIRAAFDGKVRGKPRVKAKPAGSAVAAMREAWKDGHFSTVLGLLDTDGGVFFGHAGIGHAPRVFIKPEFVTLAGFPFVIARCLLTGKVSVSHAVSGLAISSAMGKRFGARMPRTYSEARAQCEEWTATAAENEYLPLLMQAAAKAQAYDQAQGRAYYVERENAAQETRAADDVPTVQAAPASAPAADPAPVQAIAAECSPEEFDATAAAFSALTPAQRGQTTWAATLARVRADRMASAPAAPAPGLSGADAAPAPADAPSYAFPDTPATHSRNPARIPDLLPVLVTNALERIAVGESLLSATAWEWARANYYTRERVDAWLVRNGHSLAQLVGTGETRFRCLVDMVQADADPIAAYGLDRAAATHAPRAMPHDHAASAPPATQSASDEGEPACTPPTQSRADHYRAGATRADAIGNHRRAAVLRELADEVEDAAPPPATHSQARALTAAAICTPATHSRYSLVIECGAMRRPLSAVKHAPFSDAEMAGHAAQWAIDHQANPHTLAIAQLRDGEPFARRASNAEVNKPAPMMARTPATHSRAAHSASWVIRERRTGAVIMETFDRRKVDALNVARYEAVPILQYLGEVNRSARATLSAGP